jgi:hypothetical protein
MQNARGKSLAAVFTARAKPKGDGVDAVDVAADLGRA